MNKPLMPKATAVWLVDNTRLTFDQIADFCGLHPLEVKGIADGDVAQGIKGLDPVSTGQVTRDDLSRQESVGEFLNSSADLPPFVYRFPLGAYRRAMCKKVSMFMPQFRVREKRCASQS